MPETRESGQTISRVVRMVTLFICVTLVTSVEGVITRTFLRYDDDYINVSRTRIMSIFVDCQRHRHPCEVSFPNIRKNNFLPHSIAHVCTFRIFVLLHIFFVQNYVGDEKGIAKRNGR